MRNHYLRTLIGPAAAAEQQAAYGRSRLPSAADALMELGEEEQAFIHRRDSFYLGSIGEDGWPYVQHRGGPPGFLQVVTPRVLAFGDYTGNRQLITAGNVRARQQVALFLMDYPARERLKVIGHAEILAKADDPELAARLPAPAGGEIERIFRIEVAAYDWNCPKYITPRYTAAEVDELVAPLRARIAELERAVRSPASKLSL